MVSFKIKEGQIQKIVNIIKQAAAFDDTITFTFNADAIDVKVMHQTKVMLMYARIDTRKISEYRTDGESQITIDTKRIISALEQIGVSDLEIYTEKNDIVIKSHTMKYVANQIEPVEEPKIPNLKQNVATFKTSSNWIKKRFSYMLTVNELVDITYNRRNVVWKTRATPYEDTIQVMEYYEMTDGDDETDVTFSSVFPLEYLAEIVNAMPSTDESDYPVTVKLGTNYPLRLSYIDGNIEVDMMVAPRILGDSE